MNFHESRERIEFKKAQADYEAKVRRLIEQKLIEKGIYIDDIYDIIKQWDESQHPRDELGRWTDGDGSYDNTEDDNKRAFTRKTYYLPPNEYRKVCSEISTYYYPRFDGKEIGIIYIDDSRYHFEIKKYGEYNIYRKVKMNE